MNRARALACAALLAASVVSRAGAHVGSPDTWFEGQAGPYPIRVVVRAPGVVPGLAEISVRVLEGEPTGVTAQPFAWNAGEHGAPPPDVAKAVPGDARLYSVGLWFMVTTSYGVHVTVTGDRGSGMAIVPVQAVPTRRLPLAGALLWSLIGLGLFLCLGLLTLIGAALREGSLTPGSDAARADRHRARVGVIVAAVGLVVALAGARRWWDGVDRAYAADMYRPFHITTQVASDAGASVLRLAIDDARWRGRRWSPLIPDHGKLMHLFLVRDGDMEAFAHLHPLMSDSSHFTCALPALPAGLYRVYADIVHESGFAATLIDSVRIADVAAPPTHAAAVAGDPDDSWFTGAATPDAPGEQRFALGDDATLVWDRGSAPLVPRVEAPLKFRVLAADGSLARVEPFLGMAGHAVLRSSDGAVFAHLHPIGSVAMASQMALELRTPADSVMGTLGRRMSAPGGGTMPMPGMSGTMHAMSAPAELPGEFSIPYGFPKPGRYRLWVQVKHAGHVRTAAFDLTVLATTPA